TRPLAGALPPAVGRPSRPTRRASGFQEEVMTDAKLVAAGPRPAVRFERHLPDPPDVVWRAITDPDELKAWFPCEVAVSGGQWRPGAAISFVFSPDMTIPGEVLEVEESRLLVY